MYYEDVAYPCKISHTVLNHFSGGGSGLFGALFMPASEILVAVERHCCTCFWHAAS